MSQRERPGAAGTTAPPASADNHAARPSAPRNRPAAPGAGWEAFFPSLLPAQQHELLALAVRAGALHAGQLPPIASADRSRAFFGALLHEVSGDVLPPFRPEPIEPIDTE